MKVHLEKKLMTIFHFLYYESPLGTRSYKRQFKVTLDFPVISMISRDTFPTFNQ